MNTSDISLINNAGLFGRGSHLPVAGLGGPTAAEAPWGAAEFGALALVTVPEPSAFALVVSAALLCGLAERLTRARR